MKIDKGTFETIFIFSLSPIIAIPSIIIQVWHGRGQFIGFLISFLFGILSFKYIPTITNDKVEYFKRFEMFKQFELSDFLAHVVFTKKPDFLFDFFIFLISKTQINFNYFFLVITTFTVFSIYMFIHSCGSYFSSQRLRISNSIVALFIFSIALSSLFSQVRFYFASAIFIWILYYLFVERNILRSVLLLAITLSIHFSFAFFLPAILIIQIFKNRVDYRVLLGLSLLFYILPKSFMTDIFQMLTLPDTYSYKVDSYIKREVNMSRSAIILHGLRYLWLYFSALFLLFKKQEESNLLYVVTVVLVFVNFTNSDEFIFGRFAILYAILFAAYLLVQKVNRNLKPLYFNVFMVLFFLSFCTHLIVIRYNIMASYSFFDFITIVNIFSHKISPNDFLH